MRLSSLVDPVQMVLWEKKGRRLPIVGSGVPGEGEEVGVVPSRGEDMKVGEEVHEFNFGDARETAAPVYPGACGVYSSDDASRRPVSSRQLPEPLLDHVYGQGYLPQ